MGLIKGREILLIVSNVCWASRKFSYHFREPARENHLKGIRERETKENGTFRSKLSIEALMNALEG